ncbi:MAG: S8 family serine peptidase [Candidatus Eisenbacteria bacterium]
MRKTGLALLVITLLGTLALGSLASAENTDPRVFAPVQFGPTREAATELPYAPGRVRVKFTEQALESSTLASVEMRRGATAGRASVGILAVDNMVAESGLTRVWRLNDMPADQAYATDHGVHRWFVMELDADTDVPALCERLSADPAVEYALPDWRLYPDAVPNDTYYPYNWGHNNTAQLLSYDWATHSHENGDPVGTVGFDSNAPAAWDAPGGYGSSGVIIAIIDSGVDTDHPDISTVAGYDYGDNDSDPDDDSGQAGHGTCCAGVAAAIANNSMGAVGIAGGCKIMPMKIANSSGSMYITAMAPAIYWAVDNGTDVISMSLSASLSSEPDTDAAIQYAWNNGVLVLASTGNYNLSSLPYPANNAYVVGVGAASPCGERKRSSSSSTEVNPGVSTDPNGYTCDGERWWGSSYGLSTQDAAAAVDVIAPTILPTTDILGSGGYQSGDYEMWFNGTSCSAPYAAGVCGLIKTAYPTYSPQQIRDRLCDTAEDVVSVESGTGWDRYAGYGMVDAEAAVGGSTPQPPVANFTGTPTSGSAPLLVSFSDASSGSPTSWSWTFGDGGTSAAQNPSHTYAADGNYTVSLTVTNVYGSDTETKTNYITVATTSEVRDYAGSEQTTTGTVAGSYLDTYSSNNVLEALTEILYTSHPVKRYSYLEHRWTFNVTGGTAVTFYVEAYRPTNSDGDDFLFEYSTDGSTYLGLVTVASATEQVYSVSVPASTAGTVYVRVRDTNRGWGLLSLDTVYVDEMYFASDATAQPPVANFAANPTSGYVPLFVQFTDTSSGAPTSWSWTFGDGGTSTAQNPSHTYTAIGTHTVSLTATNDEGSDVETKPDHIAVLEESNDTVHVSSITVGRIQPSRYYYGRAWVTVADGTGAPMAGATVSGYFNAPDATTKTGVTDGSGVAEITSNRTKTPPADWCFTVTGVSLSGYTYDSGANVVTTACESGPASSELEFQNAELTEPGLRFNRPNPFRDATEIVFVLPHESHVTLEVYSVAGRRVAVLANEGMSAGPHTIEWRADGQPGGVYFCRLTTEEGVESKTMVVIR